MPVKRLKDYLDDNNIKYVTLTHSRAYTAQEIAASAHISGNDLAKTVIVNIDEQMSMVVLAASHHIDFNSLRKELGATKVVLATEEEFRALFPECETGAMPPFGNLYDMPVYVSPALTKEEMITFSAGTHTELIQMAYADFEKLVQPKVVEFSAEALRATAR
jgi:Ala-tRNA(Pro) deacylase